MLSQTYTHQGQIHPLDEPSLQNKADHAIADMGEKYACHPANRAKRKTAIPTLEQLQRRWNRMRTEKY